MNKRFVVERYGEITHCIIRQMPHDTQYGIGSTIPGFGKVVGYGDAPATVARNDPETSGRSKSDRSLT